MREYISIPVQLQNVQDWNSLLKNGTKLAERIKTFNGLEQLTLSNAWNDANYYVDNGLLPARALLTLNRTCKVVAENKAVPGSNLKYVATMLFSGFGSYDSSYDNQRAGVFTAIRSFITLHNIVMMDFHQFPTDWWSNACQIARVQCTAIRQYILSI